MSVMAEDIIVDTNIPEPKTLEAARQNPTLVVSLPPADNDENTSGAPFPNANKVTP